MADIIKTEAIVLKKRKLLDDDYVLTVFSKELGKLTLIAKGALRFNSRRGIHLQTGNLLNVQVRIWNETYYLQSTDLITVFSAVKSEAELIDAIYLFLFIIDHILPERLQEREVYNVTLRFMIGLSEKKGDVRMILQDSLNAIVYTLGYSEEGKHNLLELYEIIEKNIDEKLPYRVIM